MDKYRIFLRFTISGDDLNLEQTAVCIFNPMRFLRVSGAFFVAQS